MQTTNCSLSFGVIWRSLQDTRVDVRTQQRRDRRDCVLTITNGDLKIILRGDKCVLPFSAHLPYKTTHP
jgi:hypothetical protein